MSRTFHHGDRRIRVRGIRRSDPDLRKLARALIDIVQAEAEAEAIEQHAARVKGNNKAVEVLDGNHNVVALPKRRIPVDPEKDAA